MKNPKPLLVLFGVVLLIGFAVFTQRENSAENPETPGQAEALKPTPDNPGISIRNHESPDRQCDENLSSLAPRTEAPSQLTPSQVAGRVFPKVDLDILAFRMPPEKFAVYERMREQFPHTDWTEADAAHQAFLDKRAEFPLNLNDEQREAYADWLGEVEPVSHALVRLRAEQHGLSSNGMENGRGYSIDGFREGVPEYVMTMNDGAAVTTGASFVRGNPGFDPALGPGIDGGELYVSINDWGEIYENPEFQLPNGGGSRILLKETNGEAKDTHMTHVAGTAAAWGYNSRAQGMVPRAWIRSFIQQALSDITTYGMATPGQQMDLVNPRTGQLQLRSVVGNTSLGYAPDPHYSARSRSYDIAMRDYPYFIQFFAAGNAGSSYLTLDAHWPIAKNTISVGNVTAANRDAERVYTSGADLSGSSSRGPTFDGRIKPDFVGRGSSVYSSLNDTGYGLMSGTSMATPNVAGSVALLMDYVRQRLPQQYLRSSTYKALLAATADDRGNPGPDYSFGWGIANVHAAAKIVRQQAENPALQLIVEDSLSPNQTWTGTTTYLSDGSKPIRVNIAWLDPAGNANATDDRSPRLINDLDLRVFGPGGTEHKPYVMPFTTGQGTTPAFDASLYGAHAVPGDNITDPVEQVYIAAPAVGIYTVQVTHKGNLLDQQAQPFSLAVSGFVTESGLAPTSPVVFTEAVAQNGLLSPGEEALAAVPVVNYSRDTANDVVGTLTTTEPDVILLSNTVSYGTLTAGQTSTGNGSFRIRLAPDASPRVMELTLTLTSTSSGDSWSFPVTFTCVSEVAINGFVRDGHGHPVAGATVTWTGTSSGQTSSDANGFYAISEVDGTYNLTASKAGYVSRSAVPLTVPPYVSQDLFLDYYDLAVSPPEMSMQAASGETPSALVELTNLGTLPLPWSIRKQTYSFRTSDQTGGPAYAWNDISATGTQVTGLGDDTNHGPFPLGFSMPFYNNNFSSIRICSNGWLSFTSTNTGYATSALPNSARPENLIAPFMRDLDLRTEGTVHYQQIDDSTFVVQFTNVPRYGSASSSKATFQVVLNRDGAILFYYQRTDDPTSGLVGIQNQAKNDGLTIAYNQSFLKPNLAVRIRPTHWLTLSPISGTLPVGSTTTVNMTASTSGLNFGTHSATLFVDSNDAGNPNQPVLVLLDVVSNRPIIHSWPTASAITYGQPLSASTLSGGSANMDGSFAYTTPDDMLPAGDQTADVTFTPTDTSYSPVTGSVLITVEKAITTVTVWPTASSIEEDQALSASSLTGGSASVSGTFAFVNPASTLALGTHSVAVRFTPTDAANYNTVDGTVTVEVRNPAATITAWPTASGIVYGQALSASTLSGGSASVAGTFAFNAPSTTPTAGTYSAAVTFTPTDTANYSAVTGSVTVEVAKATPVVTAWPIASAIDYGQYIGASSLSGGSASVAGTFTFEDPATLFNGQDAFTFRVSDGEYTSDPATISITVGAPAGAPEPLAQPNGLRPWTPADLVTVAWYDAGDTATITHSSGAVSEWNDKSGNARNISQAINDQRPTFSESTISFDGINDYLMHNAAFMYDAGAVDIYTIAAVTATGDKRLVSENRTTDNNPLYNVAQTSSGGGAMGSYIRSSDNTTLFSTSNTLSAAAVFSRTTSNLYHWRDTGSSMAGRVAGGSATTRSYSRSKPLSLDRFTIGAIGPRPSSTTGSVFINAGINEVVITANLSDEERQKMEGYLAWKWNLQANLPADHPYKQAAPVVATNDAPVAHAQSVTLEPGTATAITLTGSDPNDDPLAFEIVTPPAYGTLTGTAPNLTYTPPALPATGMHQVSVIFTPADTANYHSVTGTAIVSVGDGGSPYQNWAGQYSGHDLSDPHGDNDGDGLSNFHEFAFGLDPTNGNSNNPIVTPFDKATLSFSYTRRADSGLTYTVCISPDLKDWEDLPPDQLTEVVTEGTEPGAETVGVTLSPLSLPVTNHLFLRVKAD